MGLSRYYGGRTLDGVASTVSGLGSVGVGACVSLLPQFRLRPRGVAAEKQAILAILPFLRARGLTADLTVKLSQLGQRWTPELCAGALGEICAQAKAHGAFVWVDMEQSGLVDRTIADFQEAASEHDNVGICLQTYLRRTERDLEGLLRARYPVRLVKGYYRERPPDCFDTWAETTENMRSLLVPLLEGSRRPALGTHDAGVLAEARRLLGLRPRPEFEFQFFLGAKPGLPEETAADGYNARVYIPYGALLPYFLHTLPYMDLSRNVQRLFGADPVR